ncbi:PocR ligand-binding domain-containing protein [bacterium]|nr:PocR ligand-binding domain-containing protein [bacterium]
MPKFTFPELVDLTRLEQMMHLFSEATGLTLAVLDTEENILIATGWQRICTHYHRCHSVTAKHCRESDAYIKSRLKDSGCVTYRCKNGLWDIAIPIRIQGEHVATFFSGQLFFTDNPPDPEFFRSQAERYGFDSEDYLQALKKVPVLSRETVEKYLSYLSMVAEMLSEVGFSNLKLKEQVRERELAEAETQKAHSLLKGLIDSVQDLIFYKDLEGRYLDCNESLCRFVGRSSDQIVGSTDYDLFPPEQADAFREQDSQVIRDGRPLRIEELVENSEGRPFLVDTLKTPYFGAAGEVLGLIGLARDITEIKRMQEEQAKIAKIESIGVLAGGIAHDFNNFLTAILGNISLARECLSGPGSAVSGVNPLEILADAEKASRRARDLTQQLLTFSRGGAPVKKVLAPDILIRESVGFSLTGSSSKCTTLLAPDLWPIEADPGQISQVLNNILINAHQAMTDGGVITVRAENVSLAEDAETELPSGDYIRISIKDQGPGISPELQKKIFDPYFSTKPKGNGLGLTTAYSIIRRHGGRIEVESGNGGGAAFHILLPAVHAKPAESGPVRTAPATLSGRVLVMDDDQAVRNITLRILTRFGLEVETACDGEEAVRMYGSSLRDGRPFDLVILDLTVPGGMGGRQTVAHLHELDPNVRALVSSGYSNDEVIADCTAFGFRGAVFKPYVSDELKSAVFSALSGKSKQVIS